MGYFHQEDFRARIDKIKDWLGDGVIADFDDKQIEQALADVDIPLLGLVVITLPKVTHPFITLPPITMR
ncbi:hypothetical protein ACLK1Z_20470 [Escherichia coli]